MIAIIDYGAGNLKSVINAMSYLGTDTQIVRSAAELEAADGAILPGVGAFGDAMGCLHRSGLVGAISDYINSGRPFLGICIGLQMLFEESSENPGVPGLGIFNGKIRRIPSDDGLKIPHMGWNSLMFKKRSPLFNGIQDGAYFYFVHSYYLKAEQHDLVTAQTEYGVTIDAAVECGNIFATQFHPEKSGHVGLQVLNNFIKLTEE